MMPDELRMVEECVEVMEDVCTEWECDFLLSIREQLEGRRTLTAKQGRRAGPHLRKGLQVALLRRGDEARGACQ